MEAEEEAGVVAEEVEAEAPSVEEAAQLEMVEHSGCLPVAVEAVEVEVEVVVVEVVAVEDPSPR